MKIRIAIQNVLRSLCFGPKRCGGLLRSVFKALYIQRARRGNGRRTDECPAVSPKGKGRSGPTQQHSTGFYPPFCASFPQIRYSEDVFYPCDFTCCCVNGYHLLAFEASQLAFNLYVVAEAHFLTICSTLPSSEQLWRSFVRYNSKLFHWGLSPQSGRLS